MKSYFVLYKIILHDIKFYIILIELPNEEKIQSPVEKICLFFPISYIFKLDLKCINFQNIGMICINYICIKNNEK